MIEPLHHIVGPVVTIQDSLELVPQVMAVGQVLPDLGTEVEFSNPCGVHVFEEGGQLWTKVLLPLQAAHPNLILYDRLPDRDHLIKGHIGKGPDMSDDLLEAHIMVEELHQAIHSDPFSRFTIQLVTVQLINVWLVEQ